MIPIDCTIIVPVYYNQDSIKPLYESFIENVFSVHKTKSFETIFINDGSGDNSLNSLLKLKQEYNEHKIKVIDLSRNFGQVSAFYAGYHHAKGGCIINFSADMQDPTELITEMISCYYNEGHQIVIGTRSTRDESLFRRITSSVFYALMRKLSFNNMPKGGFDTALLSKKVKDILLQNNEANPFWQGQILWTGFDIKQLPYHRKKRHSGSSKWTFSKKLTYLIDGVLGYSFLPLRLISIIGVIIAIMGFLYSIVIFIYKLIGGIQIEGWAPLMIITLLLSGTQMIMLGVIGEYLWRNLSQTRNRRPYIIKNIYE